MIKNLLMVGSLVTALYFLNEIAAEEKRPPTYNFSNIKKHQVEEIKAESYHVRFIIVTPCINGVRCLDFNEEILQGTVDYYAQYGITLEFEREFIEVEEELNIEMGPPTSPTVGFKLKLDLVEATGRDVPHIIHAPMFVGSNTDILGVAQQYTQVVVLNQQMIDSFPTEIEEHVLIHEIGHIFGLIDIYDNNSCNTMDGRVDNQSLHCQELTPEQVQHMKLVIKETLM